MRYQSDETGQGYVARAVTVAASLPYELPRDLLFGHIIKRICSSTQSEIEIRWRVAHLAEDFDIINLNDVVAAIDGTHPLPTTETADEVQQMPKNMASL